MGQGAIRAAYFELGAVKFYAWVRARKGTPWSKNLLPDACKNAADKGNAQAIEVMERYAADLIAQKLLK